jgi:hypothetical protein
MGILGRKGLEPVTGFCSSGVGRLSVLQACSKRALSVQTQKLLEVGRLSMQRTLKRAAPSSAILNLCFVHLGTNPRLLKCFF